MPEALRDQPKPADKAPPKPADKAPPKPAERPRAKEREREREPAGGRSIVPFAIGAAVVLAILGFLVGGSGGGGGETTAGAAVKSAALELQPVEGWAKVDPPAIPGMELSEAVAVGAGGQGVVAGLAPEDAHNFTLLPNQFLAEIGGPPEARPAVLLPGSDVQAYRYENVGDDLTVFAAQTDAGVVNVACFGGAGAGDCDAVAGSLKVLDGAPIPVGPDKAFAESMGALLGKLGKTTGAGRKDLAAAKTHTSQASAAAKVAAGYAAAKKELGQIDANPADQALVGVFDTALANGEKAWKALAAAARKSSKSGYVKAQRQAQQAEKGMAGALTALEAAGYTTEG